MGYVELDYRKIEGEVMTSLDLDKDGKVDTNDLQELWNRTMKASLVWSKWKRQYCFFSYDELW